MGPAWSVAPHPDATPREAPGSFREHDIHPFPGGMTPISWPFIPAEMASWVDHVNALDPSRAVFPEALAALHCRFERIHPFLDGIGRTGRLILNLILVRHGYPPAIILQARPCTVPARSAESGYGRRKRSRRDARSGDSRQPSPLRHPGRRRCGPARAVGRAGDTRHEGVRSARGGRSRTAPRHTRIGRSVAQLPAVGRGVLGEPLSPRRSDNGDRLNVRSGCAALRLAAPHLDHAVRAGLAVAGGEVTGHGYGGIQVVDQAVPVHRVFRSHVVA